MRNVRSLIACLAVLTIAVGCGELVPKIPKPNHRRGPPRKAATPTESAVTRDAPEEFRSPVDRSSTYEAEPEPAGPTAEEALAAARAKAAREDEERRKANEAARERLARKRKRAPTMELLEAGNAPLEPLRFALEKGHAETVTMTLGMSMDLETGGNKMPTVRLPDTRIQRTQCARVNAPTATSLRTCTSVRKVGSIIFPTVTRSPVNIPVWGLTGRPLLLQPTY